jgi:hypothetical protein
MVEATKAGVLQCANCSWVRRLSILTPWSTPFLQCDKTSPITTLRCLSLGKPAERSTGSSAAFSQVSADCGINCTTSCSCGLQPAFAFGTLCPLAGAARGLKARDYIADPEYGPKSLRNSG